MDTIFRSEFTGAANGEHDGALRRFECHRDLILAGTWLEFSRLLKKSIHESAGV
jgi:hypothetical protein